MDPRSSHPAVVIPVQAQASTAGLPANGSHPAERSSAVREGRGSQRQGRRLALQASRWIPACAGTTMATTRRRGGGDPVHPATGAPR